MSIDTWVLICYIEISRSGLFKSERVFLSSIFKNPKFETLQMPLYMLQFYILCASSEEELDFLESLIEENYGL